MHVAGLSPVKYSDLPSKKIRDVRGERFGRLVAIEFSHIAKDKGKNAYWGCVCDCGNYVVVSSASLRTGTQKSCGCLHRELSKTHIKKLHNKGLHLYIVRSGDYVKIGRTSNIHNRLGQLRAMNPIPIEIIQIINNGGYLEHEYHEIHKDFHHSGEWFHAVGFCEIV